MVCVGSTVWQRRLPFSSCPLPTKRRAEHAAMNLAGGAVCNSDCDGTVWLRVAKEGRADRGSFQKMSAVTNHGLACCARSALEASAPAAFAPAPALSGPRSSMPHARAAAGHRTPSPSDIEAIRLCSSFANRSEHSPPCGSWLVLTCKPACPGRASCAKTASALSS